MCAASCARKPFLKGAVSCVVYVFAEFVHILYIFRMGFVFNTQMCGLFLIGIYVEYLMSIHRIYGCRNAAVVAYILYDLCIFA